MLRPWNYVARTLDWAQRDLVEAIDRGDYPQWALKIQIITDAQAQSFAWNPFDLTRSGRIASSRSSTSVL